MKAYSIDYELNGMKMNTLVDARDIKSAKNKIARKHGIKNAKSIKIIRSSVIGYF